MAEQQPTEETTEQKRPGIFLMLGLIALITVGIVVVNRVAGVFTPVCNNTVIQTQVSPDQEHEAVMFERSCGDTTAFTTQVSVITAGGQLPDQAGNVLVAIDADEPAAWGGPQVDINWLDALSLELTVDETAIISRQSAAADDVSVTVIQAARTE